MPPRRQHCPPPPAVKADAVRVTRVGRRGLTPAFLRRLKRSISRCAFVAIDTELGGLSLTESDRPSVVDSVAARYAQLRSSARQFPIVEFGLSLFTWDADARGFRVETFAFPVFPVFSREKLPDRRFLLQPKCLQYIRKHGFDLNEWVDDGIGYLSHEEQRELQEELDRPAAKHQVATVVRQQVKEGETCGSTSTIVSREVQAALDAAVKQITTQFGRWMKERTDETQQEEQGNNDVRAEMKAFLSTPVETDPPCAALVTEPMAPFRRRALAEELREAFPLALAFDCRADNRTEDEGETPWIRRLRVVLPTSTAQHEALLEAEKQLADEARAERNAELVGVTGVMDLIVASRKPIVGHNLLLDTMQCFDKFHGPLPERCSAFQRELFDWIAGRRDAETTDSEEPEVEVAGDGKTDVGTGGLFDTKEMVSCAMRRLDVFSTHLQHSALGNCFEVLSRNPFVGPPVLLDRQDEDQAANESTPPLLQAHQAGYDAYMTGMVFLRVCAGLSVPNDVVASLGSREAFDRVRDANVHGHAELEQFRNVLHVSQFLPATTLVLPGPFPDDTPTPSRAHFLRLRLTGTAATLKTFHIKNCLSWAIDVPAAKLDVHWQGNHCVYVSFPSASNVDKLLKLHGEIEPSRGTTQDPMPSIGCVELERCESTDHVEASGQAADNGDETDKAASDDDSKRAALRRKRKSCEIDD